MAHKPPLTSQKLVKNTSLGGGLPVLQIKIPFGIHLLGSLGGGICSEFIFFHFDPLGESSLVGLLEHQLSYFAKTETDPNQAQVHLKIHPAQVLRIQMESTYQTSRPTIPAFLGIASINIKCSQQICRINTIPNSKKRQEASPRIMLKFIICYKLQQVHKYDWPSMIPSHDMVSMRPTLS